jgi:uncharacterized protein YjbI with pentapeptide repeats
MYCHDHRYHCAGYATRDRNAGHLRGANFSKADLTDTVRDALVLAGAVFTETILGGCSSMGQTSARSSSTEDCETEKTILTKEKNRGQKTL